MISDGVLEIILRILLATVISGLIGYEREHENKPAGIMTLLRLLKILFFGFAVWIW